MNSKFTLVIYQKDVALPDVYSWIKNNLDRILTFKKHENFIFELELIDSEFMIISPDTEDYHRWICFNEGIEIKLSNEPIFIEEEEKFKIVTIGKMNKNSYKIFELYDTVSNRFEKIKTG